MLFSLKRVMTTESETARCASLWTIGKLCNFIPKKLSDDRGVCENDVDSGTSILQDVPIALRHSCEAQCREVAKQLPVRYAEINDSANRC